MKTRIMFLIVLATNLIASEVRPIVFDTIRRYDIPDRGRLMTASDSGEIAVIYGSIEGFVVDSLLNAPNVPDTIIYNNPNDYYFSPTIYEIRSVDNQWFVPYSFYSVQVDWPWDEFTSGGYLILDHALNVIKEVTLYSGIDVGYFYVGSVSLDFSDTVGLVVSVIERTRLCGAFINRNGDVLDTFTIMSGNGSMCIGDVRTVYIGDSTFLIVWVKGVSYAWGECDSTQLYYSLITTYGNIVYPYGRQLTFDPGEKKLEFLSYSGGKAFVAWKSNDRWYDLVLDLNKEMKPRPNLIFEDKRIQSVDFLPVDDSFVVLWIDSTKDMCYYTYLHKNGEPVESEINKIFGSTRDIYDLRVEVFDSVTLLFVYHTVINGTEKIALRRGKWNKSTGIISPVDDTDFIPLYHFHSYYPVLGEYSGEDDKLAVVAQNEHDVLIYGEASFGPYFNEFGSFSRGCWFYSPEIARNNRNLYLLVWDDDCYYDDWDYGYFSGPNIRGYIFDLSHTVARSFFVMADDSIYTHPHVTGMDDRFIVTWQKRAFYPDTLLNSGYRIVYGPDSMGNIDSVEYRIDDVAFNGIEALLVGKVRDALNEEDSIVGTFIDKDGEKTGSVGITVLNIVNGPFVVSDSNKFFVVYAGKHADYDNNKIYGRFVYPDGSVSEEFQIYDSLPERSNIKVVYDGLGYDLFLTGYSQDSLTLIRITTQGTVELIIVDRNLTPDIPARVWPSGGFGVVESPGKVLFMYAMYVDEYNGKSYKTYGYAGKIYDLTNISEKDVVNSKLFYNLLGPDSKLVVSPLKKGDIFVIYDIEGRAVYRKKINRNMSSFSIWPYKVGLNGGIYYYVIYRHKGISKKGRFIFLK